MDADAPKKTKGLLDEMEALERRRKKKDADDEDDVGSKKKDKPRKDDLDLNDVWS